MSPFSRRRFLLGTTAGATTLLGCAPGDKPRMPEYRITDFGAVADGSRNNSRAIQKTIDTAAENGGGIVVVPEGRFVTGTILLRDNVTLQLDEDAELLGSHRFADYQAAETFFDGVGQERGACLLGAFNVSNVAITGSGTVNGRGERLQYENASDRSRRPFLIRFVNCDGVAMNGVVARNSAAWTIHIDRCRDVELRDLRILSQSEGNGDGIDIDGSQRVYVRGCDINAHDDAIALKTTSATACRDIRIQKCRLSSRWGGVKFGTESIGDFENIEISDCYIYDAHGGGIKILSVDGANIRNIVIRDIEMNTVEMPIFIRLGARLNTYRGLPQRQVGSIDGVTIRDVSTHGKRGQDLRVTPPSLIFITGLPEKPVRNIRLEDIDAIMYSSGTRQDSEKRVPEKRDQYPEFTRFDGHLPAYGCFMRHAENIVLKNAKIHSRKSERRHLVKCDDVRNLQIENIDFAVEPDAAVPFALENNSSAVISDVRTSADAPDSLVAADDSSTIELRD